MGSIPRDAKDLGKDATQNGSRTLEGIDEVEGKPNTLEYRQPMEEWIDNIPRVAEVAKVG